MPRSLHKLTATAVERLKKPGRHSDGGGLYLSLSNSGSKSWVFIWTRGGKKREMGLGPFPAVSLAKARDRAARCREQVADGLDPIIERGKDARITFGEAADKYYVTMRHRWRSVKSHAKWHRAISHHCGAILNRPVASIETDDVLKVLQPIWHPKAETARNIRGYIERILDYSKARGWRKGENAARWRGHLENILPKPSKLTSGHMPAMDYSDIPVFIERLWNSEALAARALEFTILTAARTGETLNATWLEIDLEHRIWTVPADRTKSGVEHRVPLSDPAGNILVGLYEFRVSDFVFPGQLKGKPISSMAMLMLLRRMKMSGVTVHGFRSSFRDWCGDETEFPREVAEAALSHKVGDAVERAYRRRDAFDKRRRLMESWGQYCIGVATENVVRLHA